MKHRYSAEIQRTRGLLELAAALYDTLLSFQTTRAAEQAILDLLLKKVPASRFIHH